MPIGVPKVLPNAGWYINGLISTIVFTGNGLFSWAGMLMMKLLANHRRNVVSGFEDPGKDICSLHQFPGGVTGMAIYDTMQHIKSGMVTICRLSCLYGFPLAFNKRKLSGGAPFTDYDSPAFWRHERGASRY